MQRRTRQAGLTVRIDDLPGHIGTASRDKVTCDIRNGALMTTGGISVAAEVGRGNGVDGSLTAAAHLTGDAEGS
jgi:hypothetical protein